MVVRLDNDRQELENVRSDARSGAKKAKKADADAAKKAKADADAPAPVVAAPKPVARHPVETSSGGGCAQAGGQAPSRGGQEFCSLF